MEASSHKAAHPAQQSGFWSFFLKSWQPVPTLTSTLIIFGTIGIAFVIFGIILHVINSNIIEVSSGEYQTMCPTLGQQCNVTLNIPSQMSPPVFVFYEIHNFYQNHRRYIKSKSNDQLAGTDIDSTAATSACDPIILNQDVPVSLSYTNKTLVGTDVANPCGLIARSFFNDTFELWQENNNITINDTGISWPKDKGTKFQRCYSTNGCDAKQWIDVTNEHFIVWMRTAGLPNFRKLWGRINSQLNVSSHQVRIKNNYDVSGFQGAKLFVLSTAGPFGGKNIFLEVSYFVVGGICILIAILFFARNRMTAGRFGNVPDNSKPE